MGLLIISQTNTFGFILTFNQFTFMFNFPNITLLFNKLLLANVRLLKKIFIKKTRKQNENKRS